MNRNGSRGRNRARGSAFGLATGLALALQFRCAPDLDGFSTQYGEGGGGFGGEDGGTAGSPSGGTAGTPASGAGGGPNTGASGGGGSGGSGGDTHPGGGAGEAGKAGEGGCESGRVSCDDDPDCETELDVGNESGNTVRDCGACGVECNVTNASGAACSDGACVPTCTEGFADCNATGSNDGCEAVTTALDCCGRPCSNSGATATACTAGLCSPTCGPYYADCNIDAGTGSDDGCETYVGGLMQCGNCASRTACAADQVCNDGACGAPQGVIALSVPLTATTQNQRYADRFPSIPNLANTTLTLRLFAPGALAGSVNLYLSDANYSAGAGRSISLSALSTGWRDVTLTIGGVVDVFDPSAINQVTIDIVAGDVAATWANPTVVYIDRVWSSNLVVNDTFDTDIDIDTMVQSVNQVVSGSTMTWQATVP